MRLLLLLLLLYRRRVFEQVWKVSLRDGDPVVLLAGQLCHFASDALQEALTMRGAVVMVRMRSALH
jgi:hypothetical protein